MSADLHSDGPHPSRTSVYRIICIDSDYDNTTRLVSQFREKVVYQPLQQKGHQLFYHKGAQAVKAYVRETCFSSSYQYLTGSGHGNDVSFIGGDASGLLQIGQYDPNEIRQSIIHLLACRTAELLGADLVKNGCVAFIGYDIDFLYSSNYINQFLVGDAEIDIALGEGCTVQEAYERSINKYNEMIDFFDNQGLLRESATLEENRNHLCAPGINPRWGNPNATLSDRNT